MGALVRRETQRRRSVRYGVATLALFTVMLAFALTASNGLPPYLPGVDRSEVKVAFADVGALRSGDEVRIADVRAGFVDSIDLVDGQPVVTMQLEGDRAVYQDATAVISARSALGQKFVLLNPGSTAAGEIGQTIIPAEQTISPTELDDVLDALDAPTRAAAQSTLLEVGGGATGRHEDLRDGLTALPTLLPNVGVIARTLTADGGADLSSLIATTDLLAGTLVSQQAAFEQVVRGLDETLAAVTTGDGEPLDAVLDTAPQMLAELTPVLDDLRAPLSELHVALDLLEPGAVALGESVPDLRGVLTEAVAPLTKVPGVSESATPAVESLTPALVSLQPLAVQTGTALSRASDPLGVLAPYSPEVLLFFQNAASSLSQRDAAGGWLRIYPIVQPESLLGVLPVKDPFSSRQAYPAPGEAPTHRKSTIFGEESP